MDDTDRAIVNRLQGGFPLCPRPFAVVARELRVSETALLERIHRMIEEGVLTRFGPMYDLERLGGKFTLCAMRVPPADFERVAALVNAHPEVAHNYAREHRFNMWFVVAAPDVQPVLQAIERESGYPVLDLPREAEYFIGLRLVA